MNDILYNLVPTMTFGFVGLLFIFKIWKRSISSFVAIIGLAIISNLMHYGYIDAGLMLIPLLDLMLIARAMVKPKNDTVVPKAYAGEERRGRKNV